MLKYRGIQSGGKDMFKEYFVVGDIHGEFAMLEKLLSFWEPEKQKLLFIGDLADRGPHSRACFEKVMQLVEEEGAICLRGNHEQMLLNFLNQPGDYIGNYFLNGGGVTIRSFLGNETDLRIDPFQLADKLRREYPKLLPFIQSLPLYHEWEKYLFVHAGVDLEKKDWKETDPKEFYWIRDPFHNGHNHTGKTIVFGHTPTFYLHGQTKNANIWMKDHKIGIDGGAVYGGVLHGLVLAQSGIVDHYGIEKQNNLLQVNHYL